MSQGIEIGAGWLRKGQASGKEYVSLSIAAPSSAPRRSMPTSAERRASPILRSTPSSGARKTERANLASLPHRQRCGSSFALSPASLPHPPTLLWTFLQQVILSPTTQYLTLRLIAFTEMSRRKLSSAQSTSPYP
jgi:hypothetical protein